MNVFAWNVRGLNSSIHLLDMSKIRQDYNVGLMGLLETRVWEKNYSRFKQHLDHHWNIVNNYDQAARGRIWVLWDTNIYIFDVI